MAISDFYSNKTHPVFDGKPIMIGDRFRAVVEFDGDSHPCEFTVIRIGAEHNKTEGDYWMIDGDDGEEYAYTELVARVEGQEGGGAVSDGT